MNLLISFLLFLVQMASRDVIGSTTKYSDVHIRMIHLRQANKREDDLAAFRKLQRENLFTDMTLVLMVIDCCSLFNHGAYILLSLLHKLSCAPYLKTRLPRH